MSATDLDSLYAAHLERMARDFDDALERSAQAGLSFDGVLLHAGSELLYHRDDQPFFFRTDPHFARVVPHRGSGHLLRYRPGKGFELALIVPRDYWYEAPARLDHPASRMLDITEFSDEDAAIEHFRDSSFLAFIGDDEEVADRIEAEVEPEVLLAALDWSRGAKTEYEVHCLEEAAKKSAPGHAAVREGATNGLSERELHFAYLSATGELECDLPYPTIIGWNHNGAVLHYQSKESDRPGQRRALLIDAGVSHLGYACDITRTWLGSDAPAELRSLHAGMEELQRELVGAVAPGVSYIDLHLRAHQLIAELLHAVGVLRVDAAEAVDKGLTRPFFPHGLGHHLGLQVHDVGGHQADPSGRTQPPPASHPHLRTTRTLDEGHVVTIEPGLYFIDMLLDPVRQGEHADAVDWKLVDRLRDCGGIRIEDDVVVTGTGSRDLTRPHVPG